MSFPSLVAPGENRVWFSVDPAFTGDYAKPQSLVLHTQEGRTSAQFKIGRASVLLEYGRTAQELVVIPPMSVKRRSDSETLTLVGAWPWASVRLTFPSKAEATAAVQQLRELKFRVVQSLYAQAAPGAPLLAVGPLHASWQQRPEVRSQGQLLLGGYALKAQDPIQEGGAPHFQLCWAELCGPGPRGTCSVSEYSSHRERAVLLGQIIFVAQEYVIEAKSNALHIRWEQVLAGGNAMKTSDDILCFRCPEEAELWAAVANAAVQTEARKLQPRALQKRAGVDEVVGRLTELERYKSSRPLLRGGLDPLSPAEAVQPPRDAISQLLTGSWTQALYKAWQELEL